MTGKLSKYFPGLINKIQGPSSTEKKNPKLLQDVATLDEPKILDVLNLLIIQ